jgi:hypothetical protein
MIEYIHYQYSKSIVFQNGQSITLNHHLTYVINMYMKNQFNDVVSYLKNYKKKYGNQYQIPIFINVKTTLIVVYGYRSANNYALNIHSIKKLVDKEGMCNIYFEKTHVEIQKKCRYIKSSILKGLRLHKEIMENIFMG